MLSASRRKRAQPKQQRKSVKSWLKGYMSELDDGRMPEDGLAIASDVVLSQNGTVKPAFSSIEYGTQPTGTIQGEVFPFTRLNSGEIENYVCFLMNVSGTVNLYYQKDGGTITKALTKNFNVAASGRFAQIQGYVVVASTTDPICWLNTSTFAMVVTTALGTPTTPTASVAAALVGTNHSYYYRYAAADVGESIQSASVKATTLIMRGTWTAATQYIDLTLTRLTNARSYNIYVGIEDGSEYYIGSIADPGTGTTFVYRDDGTVPADTTRPSPDADTSALPKLSHVRVLDGRIYGWGDYDNKWRVWYGGSYAPNYLKFSVYYGGGYTPIADGTPYVPNNVSFYRTGKGDPIITVFCRGTSGQGKRYTMQETSTTVGDTIITVMGAREDNGAYGTNSPDGVVLVDDDIIYPSDGAFKKTGTRVNLQNLLSTRGITDNIQGDVEALNALYMHKCVGLYFQGRVYWAVPYGSATSNNQIWTLDVTRGGAWMLPMDVSADWLWLYEDSDGKTHFCYLSGNKIMEFTYSRATSRDGVAFPTSVGSGLLKFSEDGQEWADVEKVKFILIRPQGAITGKVSGKTEDAPIANVGSESFVSNSSVSGLGEDALGMYYLGEARLAPSSYGAQREELEIEIGEEMQWLQWQLNSTGLGVQYELSDFIIYYTLTGVKD